MSMPVLICVLTGCIDILGSLATSQSDGILLEGGYGPLVSMPMISIKHVCVLLNT